MAKKQEQIDAVYQDFNALLGRQPTPEEAETIRTSGKNVGQFVRANTEFLNKYPGGYVLTPGRGGWGQVTEGGEFQFITSPEDLGQRRQAIPFEGEPQEVSDQFIQAFMRSPFGKSDEELAPPPAASGQIGIPAGETITPFTPPPVVPEFLNSLDPNKVLARDNVTQTLENPAPPPEPEPDLYGIREAITKELNLPGLQTELTGLLGEFNTQKATLTEELNKSKADLRAAELAAQGRLDEFQDAIDATSNDVVSQQVINLRQQKIAAKSDKERRIADRELNSLVNALKTRSEAAAQKLDLLESQIGAKQDTLRAAQNEAAERFGLRAGEIKDKQKMILQFPEAGIRFSDTTTQVAAKIFKAQTAAENRDLSLKFPEAGITERDTFESVRNKIVAAKEAERTRELDQEEYNQKKDLLFKFPGAEFGFDDDFPTISRKVKNYLDTEATKQEAKQEQKETRAFVLDLARQYPYAGIGEGDNAGGAIEKVKPYATQALMSDLEARALDIKAKEQAIRGNEQALAKPNLQELQGGLYNVDTNSWVVKPPPEKAGGGGIGGSGGKKYADRLKEEVNNVFNGRYGIDGAREQAIQILKQDYPDQNVENDIYTRVPDNFKTKNEDVVREKYKSALDTLRDPKTGFADANIVKELMTEFNSVTGKSLKDISKNYIDPNDPMFGKLFGEKKGREL